VLASRDVHKAHSQCCDFLVELQHDESEIRLQECNKTDSVCLCNPYCCGKAVGIKYSECVSVFLR
jgi:hypothetical protein